MPSAEFKVFICIPRCEGFFVGCVNELIRFIDGMLKKFAKSVSDVVYILFR